MAFIIITQTLHFDKQGLFINVRIFQDRQALFTISPTNPDYGLISFSFFKSACVGRKVPAYALFLIVCEKFKKLKGGVSLSNKEYYMKSSAGVTIIKSCGNISLALIAEFSKYDNFDVALSLLEDIKKSLIAYQESRDITAHPLNAATSRCALDMPQSLYGRLAARAADEKCSTDTLCVYALSRFLSHGL